MLDPMLALYTLPLAVIWGVYAVVQQRHEAKARATLKSAFESGMSEPASLHPVIDPSKCFGCGACTKVCPEGDVIGLIDGKAKLIEPTACIGHGACKTACPFDAITLVFGTASRGVDIPNVAPSFETNVPGIFIAGELGGMGLIANAVEQGRQAIDSIAGLDGLGRNERFDVVIIGSGPAGIAASLAAKQQGLSYVTLEQETFGGTVAHYPRNKLIMTRPATLPIVGKMKFREVRKEVLLDFWYEIASKHGLAIRDCERVDQVIRGGGTSHDAMGGGPHGGPNNGASAATSFTVVTGQGNAYPARAVLLAIGRRGTPRKLGVPGEDQSKVVYRLSDPAQYSNASVLVVGGGDSALEAAADLAETAGTKVILSYRGAAFQKAKQKNRQRVEQAVGAGRLEVFLQSNLRAIGEQTVDIEINGRLERIANDAIIVCAGGVLPTKFLADIGVEVETKYGTA